jgi:hypothetical protein
LFCCVDKSHSNACVTQWMKIRLLRDDWFLVDKYRAVYLNECDIKFYVGKHHERKLIGDEVSGHSCFEC